MIPEDEPIDGTWGPQTIYALQQAMYGTRKHATRSEAQLMEFFQKALLTKDDLIRSGVLNPPEEPVTQEELDYVRRSILGEDHA